MKFTFKKLVHHISLIGVFIIAIGFVFISLAKVEKASYENGLKAINDSEWNYISAIIQSAYIDAYHNAQDSLDSIVSVAKSSYYKDSPEKLYNDLVNYKENNPINLALEKSIQNVYTYQIVSYSNDGFIANDWGILHDYSADCAKFGPMRPWSKEIPGHYNQELAKENIENMKLRITINPYDLQTWYGWQFLTSPYGIKFKSTDPIYLKEIFLNNNYNWRVFDSLEFSYWLPVFVDKDLAGNYIIKNGIINLHNASFWIYYGFNVAQIINGVPSYKAGISTFDYMRNTLENNYAWGQFFILLGSVFLFMVFMFLFSLIHISGHADNSCLDAE